MNSTMNKNDEKHAFNQRQTRKTQSLGPHNPSLVIIVFQSTSCHCYCYYYYINIIITTSFKLVLVIMMHVQS